MEYDIKLEDYILFSNLFFVKIENNNLFGVVLIKTIVFYMHIF
jgi:hypothetical protein